MHLTNGTFLRGGTYQIIRFIASGGFGCTYEAIHPLLGKRFAIKEFFPETICNREANSSLVTVGTLKQKPLADKLKEKFIKEAGALAQLSHPGIVKVSDVFEENGTAYYVMDYIEGKSLDKIIKERGPLSEGEALGYIRQVCQALDYVHEHNRLHLDIKPGNIMVEDSGRAVLIDFGASKQYEEANGEKTSTLIGKTPGFAPIEQMGNDVSHFTAATDIYALGATLYKCLTGKTPLESTRLANGEELDPLPSNVSQSTKKAISAAMQVGSKKRPQTVKEFLSILDQTNSHAEEAEKETEEKEKTVLDFPPKQPPSPSRSSKAKVYFGVAAAFIIALLCLLCWKVFGGNESIQTNKEEEEIAWLSDSLNNLSNTDNTDGQLATQDNLVLNGEETVPASTDSPFDETNIPTTLTFQIVPPLNVKVGDEFKVVYRLTFTQDNAPASTVIDSNHINFKDISGCKKLSGPQVTENKNSVEYTFIYKAENEGTYNIPKATVKVDGKLISSNTFTFSVNGDLTQVINEPVAHPSEPVKNPVVSTGEINGHEYVDLGLPSGIKWASCNVGATRPEYYGSYFAWGETKPKSSYLSDNCQTWNHDNQWLQSHGFLDANGNLTLINDAARQNWGGSWRMPTMNEIKELINNTTAEWATRNGVKGRLIKSKNNEGTIFLPAAGWYNGSTSGDVGKYGAYWSSTPNYSNSGNAYVLWFYQDKFVSGLNYRYLGFSVRPVSD